MRKDLIIPKQMSHLKIDPRGYPIPFFVPIVNGEPNFKYADHRKQELAIEKKLCHICGLKLIPKSYYFITGPMGLKNRVVTDAAMHRECAEFSLQACPHMFFQKAERKADEDMAPMAGALIMAKPSELYLIKSDKFEARFNHQYGYKLIHFRVTGTDKFIYVDNKLQKA